MHKLFQVLKQSMSWTLYVIVHNFKSLRPRKNLQAVLLTKLHQYQTVLP